MTSRSQSWSASICQRRSTQSTTAYCLSGCSPSSASEEHRWPGLQSYLEVRTQFVKLGRYQSPVVKLEVGVPQGSVLGPLYNKKLSWCWQTRATRLGVKSWSSSSSIPYVTYSFLLCNSNFVFKTARRYSTSKMSWPWYRVRGHSRSLKVGPFERLCMVSY